MQFDEKELNRLLRKKREADIAIAHFISASSNGTVRFSSKKFVGDLGEFYFLRTKDLFVQLTQSSTSNKQYDFDGILSKAGLRIFGLPSPKVRIEVKTRHAQVGDNHIFGVHPDKFDLLAFVALADDLTCRHIGIIRSLDITVDRQNRIKYSKFHNNNLVRWTDRPWTELV